MAAVLLVIEHVRQHEGVKVPPLVERTDGVGVVRPALVARDVALDIPRQSAVEGLVEAEEMVVALRVDEPLALPDQVHRVRGVDANVRLGVILHEQHVVCHVLLGERPDVLAGVYAAGAERAATVGVTGVAVAGEVLDLRCVAAGSLGRRRDVRDALLPVAGGERRVGLIAPRRGASPGGGGRPEREHHGQRDDRDDIPPQDPSPLSCDPEARRV